MFTALDGTYILRITAEVFLRNKKLIKEPTQYLQPQDFSLMLQDKNSF